MSDPLVIPLLTEDRGGGNDGTPKPSRDTPVVAHAAPMATADLAFVALQYLSTPILVLSSSATVIIANSAMHRLLVGDAVVGCRGMSEDDGHRGSAVVDNFYGLSLSQIGITPACESQQCWTGWRVFSSKLGSFLIH